MRRVFMGVLILASLILIYGAKPLQVALMEWQEGQLDTLARFLPYLRGYNFAVAEMSRRLFTAAIYAVAVVCLAGAALVAASPGGLD